MSEAAAIPLLVAPGAVAPRGVFPPEPMLVAAGEIHHAAQSGVSQQQEMQQCGFCETTLHGPVHVGGWTGVLTRADTPQARHGRYSCHWPVSHDTLAMGQV